jgi:hypothetical protein
MFRSYLLDVNLCDNITSVIFFSGQGFNFGPYIYYGLFITTELDWTKLFLFLTKLDKTNVYQHKTSIYLWLYYTNLP